MTAMWSSSAIVVNTRYNKASKLANPRESRDLTSQHHHQHHHHHVPETQVQVQTSSGASGTKHHQIIIDIKQDIDMDELSTRALTESVMETLAARSVLIDNTAIRTDHHLHHRQDDEDSNVELETLTTVNVIVASDGTCTPAPPDPQELGLSTAGRVVADRIAELTAVTETSDNSSPGPNNNNSASSGSSNTTTASSSTASGID